MTKVDRRNALKTILTGSAIAGVSGIMGVAPLESFAENPNWVRKGNIRHSVARWCFSSLTVDELCIEAKKLGITAIDLVGPEDWPILKKHGLDASLCSGAEINLVDGWNDPKFHDQLVKNYSEMIPKVAEAGYRSLICFSGNKRGKTDEEGWSNCVTGLKRILPLAEKHGVTLVMELLNSKVDHKDYQCDTSAWGVTLCKRLETPYFKLLYDIYHMQIDEGNIIANIRKNHQYFDHYHTAGVPGRNELGDQQELYYPAIMRAILATGFKGYVAQEFIPRETDKIASLKKAIEICDI